MRCGPPLRPFLWTPRALRDGGLCLVGESGRYYVWAFVCAVCWKYTVRTGPGYNLGPREHHGERGRAERGAPRRAPPRASNAGVRACPRLSSGSAHTAKKYKHSSSSPSRLHGRLLGACLMRQALGRIRDRSLYYLGAAALLYSRVLTGRGPFSTKSTYSTIHSPRKGGAQVV